MVSYLYKYIFFFFEKKTIQDRNLIWKVSMNRFDQNGFPFQFLWDKTQLYFFVISGWRIIWFRLHDRKLNIILSSHGVIKSRKHRLGIKRSDKCVNRVSLLNYVRSFLIIYISIAVSYFITCSTILIRRRSWCGYTALTRK